MPLSLFEESMGTVASVFSEYLEEQNGVDMMSEDGLNRLLKEQFPHCEKKETSPGVYKITVPLEENILGTFYRTHNIRVGLEGFFHINSVVRSVTMKLKVV